MSLRAKLEAVVYAAEEPVTLPQLAAVFGDEVRALLAEQTVPAPEAVTAEGADDAPASSETPSPESAESAPSEEATAEPAAADLGADVAAPSEADSPAELTAAEPSEAEAKRVARQQERAIRDYLRQELDSLMAELAAGDRGLEIREIAGGYRMATKPEYHDAIRAFVKSLKPPMKLSLQALETLAVVAYKQPVTAPEITEIRGVESGGVLGSLLSRKLIATAGRKQVIGRPILYKTTKEFLLRFGLKDLSELPSMEEFEKMAGELADGDLEPVAPSAENAQAESGAGDTTGAGVDVTTGHDLPEHAPATENPAGIPEEAEIVVGEAPTPSLPEEQPAAAASAETQSPEPQSPDTQSPDTHPVEAE